MEINTGSPLVLTGGNPGGLILWLDNIVNKHHTVNGTQPAWRFQFCRKEPDQFTKQPRQGLFHFRSLHLFRQDLE